MLDKATDVKSALDTVNAMLGIEGVTPHTFRHTWATKKITDGFDTKKITEFMDDNEATVLKNYEHLAPCFLADFVQIFRCFCRIFPAYTRVSSVGCPALSTFIQHRPHCF